MGFAMPSRGPYPIPDTRGGRVYRRFLAVAGLASIVGFADAGRALLWMLLEMAAGAAVPPLGTYGTRVLSLIAWGLLGVISYRGWRLNLLPSVWAVMSIPLICWALILTQ